jgi:3-phenylpropionate/trans-cinnamate dioxygenase ferredoxin subunit
MAKMGVAGRIGTPIVAAMDEGYRPVTTADLEPGETRCLELDGRPILVARGKDGAYYSFERRCSHAHQDLKGGRVRGTSYICPHHGARFDMATGKALGPPASFPIAAWPTRERDGQVEVRIAS